MDPGSRIINVSQFNHFMNTRNKQLGIVQQEVGEIKQLMHHRLKAPPSALSFPSQLPHLPDSDSTTQPHPLGAIPRALSFESRQQEQQEQPFIP